MARGSNTFGGWRIRACLAFLLLAITEVGAGAESPEGAESWEDRDHYPEAYSILTSDRILFPDDVSDWPLRIDSTRQLFVDDFLLSEIEGLTREFHQPEKHPGNPLMEGGSPVVLHDADQSLFRMWCGLRYFTSADGVHWDSPALGPDGNVVFPEKGDLQGLMYNPDVPEEEGRYKAVLERRYSAEENEPGGFYLYHSRDGINWERRPSRPILQRTINNMKPCEFRPMGVGSPSEFAWGGTDHFQSKGVDDTTRFRYDTVLKRYVCDGKFLIYFPPDKIEQLGLVMDGKPRLRLRTFAESDDLIHWTPPRFTMYPDRLDPPDRQIYAHTGFVYESMWLGIIQAMRFQPNNWKQVELQLSYSRDGRHWSRPRERRPFIPLGSADSWEADYSGAPLSGPVLVGEELHFYYFGSRNPARDKGPESRWPRYLGLAKLRRDGFASLNAGDAPGQVLTRPLAFQGRALYVNAEVGEGGWVKAAVLSRDSEPLAGYALNDGVPLARGTTAGRMTWKSTEELVPVGDDHVRIRFQLKDAKLYSFWVE